MSLPKIKFDEFLRLHEKNRDKWWAREYTVTYTTTELFHSVSQEFRFGIIDTIRYIFWKRKREKEKERKAFKENLEKAYASMYKDETNTSELN